MVLADVHKLAIRKAPNRGVGGVGKKESLGLRERKKRATRQALHSAALRLVAEHGLEAVTILHIVEAVDIAPRTFFNYYASKEDVIVNPDPEGPERIAQALGDVAQSVLPFDAIRQVLRDHALKLQEDRETWLLRLRLVREIPALTPGYLRALLAVENVLVADIARRTGKDVSLDLEPMLIASASVAALRSAVFAWSLYAGQTDVGELVDKAFSAISRGLSDL